MVRGGERKFRRMIILITAAPIHNVVVVQGRMNCTCREGVFFVIGHRIEGGLERRVDFDFAIDAASVQPS